MPLHSLAAVTAADSSTLPTHQAPTSNGYSNAVSGTAQHLDQAAAADHAQGRSDQQTSAGTSNHKAHVSEKPESQTAASDSSEHGSSTEDQQGHDSVQPDPTQASRVGRVSAKLGLTDPNKRLLAKMGSSNAAGASPQLMHEIGARASVQGLLQVRGNFLPRQTIIALPSAYRPSHSLSV